MRQLRVGLGDGGNQGFNHLRLDPVAQMARSGDIVKAAPAVGNLVVLGQGVGYQRKSVGVLAKSFAQRFGGGLAFCPVRQQQLVQRRLNGQLFAIDIKAQTDNRLVKQPVPSGSTGHRFFVQQALQFLGQLIGALLADINDPGRIVSQRGHGQRRLQRFVVDLVELKLEKQQLRRDVVEPRLSVAIKFSAGAIGIVAGIVKPGKRPQPPQQVGQRFIGGHRRAQLFSCRIAKRDFNDFAVIGFGKPGGVLIGFFEIVGKSAVARPGIKGAQIPFGQIIQNIFARTACIRQCEDPLR